LLFSSLFFFLEKDVNLYICWSANVAKLPKGRDCAITPELESRFR